MNVGVAKHRSGFGSSIHVALVLTLPLFAAVGWTLGLRDAAAEEGDVAYHLKLAAGQPDGAYFQFARALAKMLDGAYQGVRPLVDLEVVETDASLDNLERLENGAVEAAVLQSDIAYEVWHGEGKLADRAATDRVRGVAALFPEMLHIMSAKILGSMTSQRCAANGSQLAA